MPSVEATMEQQQPTTAAADLSGYDPVQVALMKETIVVVDENDKVLQQDSKANCHLMSNIERGLLHRAFSVFLFNRENKLLLQQRAESKITFPMLWTNTCCSHPLYHDAELDMDNNMGVKRAAQRKLYQELGIMPAQVPLDQFHFLTRIHYKAPSQGGEWGEHEIDHILFIKADVDTVPNDNEVHAIKYVSQEELRLLIDPASPSAVQLTPWFSLIADSHLFPWWDLLADDKPLPTDDKILRML